MEVDWLEGDATLSERWFVKGWMRKKGKGVNGEDTGRVVQGQGR